MPEREGCEDWYGEDLSSLLPRSMKVPWRSLTWIPKEGGTTGVGGSVLLCCSKLLAGPYCRGHASAVVCSAVLCLRFFLLYAAFARGNKLFPQLLEFQHFPQRTLNSCLFLLLMVLVLPLQTPLISHPWVFFPFSSGNLTWNIFRTCAPLNISISSPVPPFLSSPSFFIGLYSWGVCFPSARSGTFESLFLKFCFSVKISCIEFWLPSRSCLSTKQFGVGVP